MGDWAFRWAEAIAIAEILVLVVGVQMTVLAAGASVFVGVVAWRTSIRATRASELAAEAAQRALDIEVKRDEDSRREEIRRAMLAVSQKSRANGLHIAGRIATLAEDESMDPASIIDARLVEEVLVEVGNLMTLRLPKEDRLFTARLILELQSTASIDPTEVMVASLAMAAVTRGWLQNVVTSENLDAEIAKHKRRQRKLLEGDLTT